MRALPARAAKRVEALIERSSIVVLASQSENLIGKMCNRAILLDHGRVIADGPTKDVLEIYSRMNKDERSCDCRLRKKPSRPVRNGHHRSRARRLTNRPSRHQGVREPWTSSNTSRYSPMVPTMDGILALYKNPLIKGFTTNPTLMRKAGIEDYEDFRAPPRCRRSRIGRFLLRFSPTISTR